MTSCTPCGPGTTTSAPGATGPEMCLGECYLRLLFQSSGCQVRAIFDWFDGFASRRWSTRNIPRVHIKTYCVIVCNCAFLAAAACGSLGNEITTINPGPPWTEQTSTGNLASTTTTLPSLCPAFGTTQPLPKGAAFFIIEPASTNFRLIEATTCVPAQGAAFALQAFSSSGEQSGRCLCSCRLLRRARMSAVAEQFTCTLPESPDCRNRW